MEILFIILIIFSLAFYFYIRYDYHRYKKNSHDPYDYTYMPYCKTNLLTKEEHDFFVILIRQAMLRGLIVCPKVGLENIAFVTDYQNSEKYWDYVKSRHVDFMLINTQGETIAVIELDDSNQNTEQEPKMDTFKIFFFSEIGIPLIPIKAGTNYTAQLTTIFDSMNLKAVDPKKH